MTEVNINPNNRSPICVTDSSIQTIPDFNPSKEKFLKVFSLILCISNSIIGFLIEKKQILKEEFNHSFLLLTFVYGYTYILITAFVFGIIFAILFYVFIKIYSCIKKQTNTDNPLINNNLELSISYDSNNESECNVVNIAVVVFIFNLILLYFIAIPVGSFLIYKLLNHHVFANYARFYLLYLFIFDNVILGVTTLIVFLYVLFFIHIKISNKQKIKLDEELVKQIEGEIERTSRVSGVIHSNNKQSLIKINNLFEKQDAVFNRNGGEGNKQSSSTNNSKSDSNFQ